ncbi:MAG TPA: hypothetical protein VGJ07_04940 [Rugosimonospora sp.]
MTAEQAFQAISSVTDRQRGLVTAAQMERLGVDRADREELSRRGALTKLDWDVFEIVGSPTPPRYAYSYAAWLALRPTSFVWERPGAGTDLTADAVISHESAARAWGLGAPSPGRATLTAPEPLPAPRGVRVLVGTLRTDDVTVHQGLPVTIAHRTILDLVRSSTDHLELRGIITDAVRLDLVDLADLHRDLSLLADQFYFPATGPEFAGWFLPNLDDAALSPRNARALDALLAPAVGTAPDAGGVTGATAPQSGVAPGTGATGEAGAGTLGESAAGEGRHRLGSAG